LKRKNSEKMMKKLQAAMEYLMTYGWAILIIALALGVLYSLGIMNPSRLRPVMCLLPAPFNCQAQSFTTTGSLTIILAQGSGSTFTITRVACVDNARLSTSTGLPSNSADWTDITDVSLPSGSTITISGIKCIKSDGTQYSGTMGSAFGGTLIVEYTLSSGATAYSSGAINLQVNTP
jgi:hypothetical protein